MMIFAFQIARDHSHTKITYLSKGLRFVGFHFMLSDPWSWCCCITDKVLIWVVARSTAFAWSLRLRSRRWIFSRCILDTARDFEVITDTVWTFFVLDCISCALAFPNLYIYCILMLRMPGIRQLDWLECYLCLTTLPAPVV